MTINVLTIVFSLLGLLIGLLASGLFFKSRNSTLQANYDNAVRQLEDTRNQAQIDLQEVKDNFEQRLSDMKADEQRHYEGDIAAMEKVHQEALKTLKEHYENAVKDQQGRFDTAMEQMANQNKAATEDMLKARQKEFAESSSTHIGQIVNPLKETIEKMEKAMKESSEKSVEINTSMQENLKAMMEQNKLTQATTEGLTNVLKHTTKAQGDWGETVLSELLRAQGLTEGVHFHKQVTLRDEKGNTLHNDDGSAMRPDIIVHLDQSRDIIIDSKVSLTAFFNYVNSDSEEAKHKYLKEHISSIQNHVNELAQKDYTAYIRPPKERMDYVIMFVPHTAALWTALNAQPNLWRNAMARNVYIADEQTLYAALKIINMTWTQIKQAENHEKLYQLAEEMVNRVGLFMKQYHDMGNALKKAQEAYDEGGKKLSPKGQSIIGSANKLLKLGVRENTKNPIPKLSDPMDEDTLELPEASDEGQVSNRPL